MDLAIDIRADIGYEEMTYAIKIHIIHEHIHVAMLTIFIDVYSVGS